MRLADRVSLVVFTLLGVVRGYGNPGTCSGQCWSHDPSVIRRSSDSVYFRFETGNEIGIWKSSALPGPWVYQGKVIPRGSSIKLAGNTDLWAPDVHQIGSNYILYYSVSTFGSQNSAIGYATSDNMENGSWVDHGSTGVASSKGMAYNAIDANLVPDGSKSYMNFGSFWGDIYQVAMTSDGTAASGSAYQIAYNATGQHPLEGSYMYYRDGYYYLFFSSGICCGYDTSLPKPGEEYKIYVCRSASATGDFVDMNGVSCLQGGGTLLLASHGQVFGPGGQGLLDDPTQGTILYYHYSNLSIGLADSQTQFGWNIIDWSDGWPSV